MGIALFAKLCSVLCGHGTIYGAETKYLLVVGRSSTLASIDHRAMIVVVTYNLGSSRAMVSAQVP